MPKSTRTLDSEDKRELYRLFIELQKCVSEIESLARGTKGWEAAKAYWFGYLSSSIGEGDYFSGGNPTFKSYLIDQGVINEDGSFIEDEDEDEDEDEGE